MTPMAISKRLAALEAQVAAAPVHYTAEEREAARLRYVELLNEPWDPTPQQAAYYASRTLHEIQADYTAMLNGAPAPWE